MDKAETDLGPSPELSKKLPDFEQFAQEMKRWLTLVPPGRLEPLLKCLYLAAQDKIALEEHRSWATEEVAELRQARISMGAAEQSLSALLRHLESENAKHRDAFEQIEESVEGEEFEFTFDEIVQHLKDALEAAINWQIADARLIHPDLRNKTEKQFAAKRLPRAGTDPLVPHAHPARPLSPDIDHWFIGAAADCIDRCFDRHGASKAKKLPRYDIIISELFKVAFNDHGRNQENVRQELGRQRKAGSRPVYDRVSDSLIDEDRAESQNEQKSSRSPSRRRKLSKQK